MTPFRRPHGRPPKPRVDPATLEVLTLPQVLVYCRARGRGIGRKKLLSAIVNRELPALEDCLRRDRYGHHLLLVRRADFDRWLVSSLRPFRPSA
ncbi:MAG TPA: hypothetical protein VJ570_08455 [Holophagaceae bacterium]|nr:hypothetical protein [Holophagaceae bacterium]